MRYARALRHPFVLSAALLLAGCQESPVDPGPVDPGPGAGPNGPGTPPPPPPPPPEPATASVPHGTPALYLSTSTDASVFNGIIGEVIEGSRQNFVQLVPATGEAALIDSNLSVSYAQSRSTIKTFDDGIYIVNVSETGARLQRFDNEALLSSPPDRPVPAPRAFDSLEEDCFVVQGNDIVYKVAWRRAGFPGIGYSDAPLVRVTGFFDGGSDITTLIPGVGGDAATPGGFVTDACQFHMDWADGVWYDVANRVENDELAIYRRDADTGLPTRIGALDGMSAYEHPNDITNLAFDRDRVYFASLEAATQTIRVTARPVEGAVFWQTLATVTLTDFTAESLHGLDVDDGYATFVVNPPSGDDYVALLEPGVEGLRLFAIGAPVNQLQIVYRD